MRCLVVLVLVVLWAGPLQAADVIVRDGRTLQLGSTTYRLDGIDAPDFDQMCIDDHADSWTCGVDARDHLTKLIGARSVHCDDIGPDPSARKLRHLGLCRIDDETSSLNQMLVAQGFALNFEPSAKGRFKADESDAKAGAKGLWKGCFAVPQDFRQWKIQGALLGASCRSDKVAETRALLFPEAPTMPPACSIKAKYAVRARVTGNVGVYQLQGCPSYASTTRPNRWFCSEDDARAAGFRRAYNCAAGAREQ